MSLGQPAADYLYLRRLAALSLPDLPVLMLADSWRCPPPSWLPDTFWGLPDTFWGHPGATFVRSLQQLGIERHPDYLDPALVFLPILWGHSTFWLLFLLLQDLFFLLLLFMFPLLLIHKISREEKSKTGTFFFFFLLCVE